MTEISGENRASRQRQAGVDFGRLVAVAAVICLHVQMAPGVETAPWYALTVQLARSAVPFFFVAMGYFSRIDSGGGRTGRVVWRLLGLYVLWFVLYALAFGPPEWSHWRQLLMGGIATPLWFLFSGALSLGLVALLVRFIGVTPTLVACLVLYALGLAFGPYCLALFGFDAFAVWNTRDGVTFAAPFIAIGVFLARTDFRLRTPVATALLLVAALLQLGEAALLQQTYGLAPTRHDFVLATLPFGVAVFLFFQSLNGTSWVEKLSRLAPLVLGIYLVHFALLRAASHLYLPGGPGGFLAYVVGALVLSAAIVAVLLRLPVAKLAVTTGPIWQRRRSAQPADTASGG